uniref:C2H2-type domain-containing protein n=1 Tax=Macrostomum lignano TaxID=282301 RepID=A0A1I8H9X0_9PLAT
MLEELQHQQQHQSQLSKSTKASSEQNVTTASSSSELRCLWLSCTDDESDQSYCGRLFHRVSDIVQHVTSDHLKSSTNDSHEADERKDRHVCHWLNCPRQRMPFTARYKLVNHIRVHTGERPFRCNFVNCGRRFARAENLKIHLRIHTGEKPFACDFPGCDRRFANSSDRKKHAQVHASAKGYRCQVANCGKSYSHPSSLRKHSRVHSDRTQS